MEKFCECFLIYMQTQPEINEKMRSTIIDWLVDVHLKFDLSPETLYLTVNIISVVKSLRGQVHILLKSQIC